MIDLWQPRSPCGAACLPVPGATPAVAPAVWLGRLLSVAAVVLSATVVLRVAPRLARPWARAVLRGLGIRWEVRGRLPVGRALLVANHVSWLDIVVLLALTPARLVAKHDVRQWPLFGRIAESLGTIFIDRSRPRALPSTVAGVTAALRDGAAVAAFPEGTTWCGREAGSFRPALFQAALDAEAPVVPVTLRFRLRDGGGTTAAAFLADETLWDSLRRVLSVRGMVVSVTLHPALYAEPGVDRRRLRTIAMYRV